MNKKLLAHLFSVYLVIKGGEVVNRVVIDDPKYLTKVQTAYSADSLAIVDSKAQVDALPAQIKDSKYVQPPVAETAVAPVCGEAASAQLVGGK